MADSISPRYGRPDTFLSRKDHREFRGITTLLELTDSDTDRNFSAISLPEEGSTVADNSEEMWRLPMRNVTRLFVRGRESITTVRAGYTAVVAVSTGPRNERNNLPHTSGPAIPALGVALRAQISEFNPLDSKIVTSFVMSLRNYRRQPVEGGRLPYPYSFEQHCQRIMELLKQQYETDADTRWRDYLRHYVLMSSCTKILSRFETGFGEDRNPQIRNIARFLQRNGINDFDDRDDGTSEYDLRADLLSDAPATTAQRNELTILLRRLLHSGYVPKPFASGFLEKLENSTEPLYDRLGRAHFQFILSLAFKRANNSVRVLASELKNNVPNLGCYDSDKTNWDAPLQPAIEAVKVAVQDAWESLESWSCFLNTFEDVIGKHLFWIEAACKLTVRYHVPIPVIPIPSQNLHKRKMVIDPTSNSIASTCIDAADMSNYINDDDEDTLTEEMHLLEQQKSGGWSWRAKQYIFRTAEYTNAVIQLEPKGNWKDKEFWHFLNNINFTALEFRPEPDRMDKEMSSINGILGSLVKEGILLADNVQLVKERLHEGLQARFDHRIGKKDADKLFESTKFTGTCHCESIPMALNLLANSAVSYIDTKTDPLVLEAAEDQSLRLPEKRIMDKLATLDVKFNASKIWCCQACNVLGQQVKQRFENVLEAAEQNEQQAREGYSATKRVLSLLPSNNIWTAAALPPWTPKEDGLKVIEAAKLALIERLKRAVEHQIRKRITDMAQNAHEEQQLLWEQEQERLKVLHGNKAVDLGAMAKVQLRRREGEDEGLPKENKKKRKRMPASELKQEQAKTEESQPKRSRVMTEAQVGADLNERPMSRSMAKKANLKLPEVFEKFGVKNDHR